ncbi:alpha-1,4-glucan--maltose-1-phosphate maltosyltransferase [Varibaculum cambriense]|uniref:alpha-1,4-glucan--maltose-1-phosphate maltosyltransferase n=1 Tax=Varibaculum cambriense TaxID=184870 RepID=UPI0029090EE3|nr:alpha-1,4-glucan--maltose-1-phosphate maltosyltransferase [Varibaculum cambriense]MDU5542457.1 alpha-1,4-glucan--maltose-1-phosphate maltosyltransferase [Varibaculum cambriense]
MAGDTPRSRKTRSTTSSAGQRAKSSKVSATSSRKTAVHAKAAATTPPADGTTKAKTASASKTKTATSIPRRRASRAKTAAPKAAAAKPLNLISPEARLARIPVTEVEPVFEDGLWPAKAVENESFPVRATVFREGHDALGAEVVLVDPQGKETMRARMYDVAPGLDRLEAWIKPTGVGDWSFRVDTFCDPYQTWAKEASIKVQADQDVEMEFELGARLFERAANGEAINNPAQQAPDAKSATRLLDAAKAMRDQSRPPQERLSVGLHSSIRGIFRAHPLRDLLESSRTYPLRVDRERALYGSWYEIFPRSIGAYKDQEGHWHSGTLRTAAADLPRIAAMGFDVAYLTPVHPIGTTFRKGRNNSLEATPDDPGSPYGIGSAQGGHDAIHPDLGDFDDFDYFVKKAKGLGLEVALDLALQCSPDHPWVKDHPQWFKHRPDGTIAYAENPPKKYQDIYPLVFDKDYRGLYNAVRDVIQKWIDHGVTIFRVDNPHTKPVQFWQEILAEFHHKHPDVLFLAEAFTRPAMMRTLAQVGFHQSYTYFTWRNTRKEIEEYFDEVAWESSPYMRPSFWPTTHDILTQVMVDGGIQAFKMRAVLAATGSPNWGIYSGYELIENVQRPGFEEQIDNEKYEYRPRDYSGETAQEMMGLLTTLNGIRRRHPALQRLRNLKVHETTHPGVVCFSRHLDAWESPTGMADTVIVVVNLDPHDTAIGAIHLDLSALKISGSSSSCFKVRDELDGKVYDWGSANYFELNPYDRPAHIMSVEAS